MTEDELTVLEQQSKPQSNSDSSGLVKASAEAAKANEGYDPYVVNYAQWLRNAEYGARNSQGLSQTQQAQRKQDYQDLIDNAPDGLSEYIEGKGYKYDADDATTNWVRDYQDRISVSPTPTSGNSTPANTTATPTTPAPKQQQPTTPKPTTQQQAVTPTQPTTTQSMAKQPQKTQPPTPPKPNVDEDIVLTNGSNTAGKIAAQPNTAMQGGFTPTPQTTPSNEPINPNTPTEAPTEQATPTPTKSATRQLIDDINAKSEEERQRIERRRQAEETISGIADMGKALSNLYFTGKGAPNMYDPKTAMTPKARERYERALKNWEKNRAASMQYALSKQSADLKQQANDLAQRKLDEQERHNKAVEDRQNKEYELREAKFEFDKYFKGESLKQKDRIAKMNDTLRRWQTERRFSQAQMAHLLASYDEYEWRDEQGNKHKTRVVQNPKTGYYSVEEDVEKGTTASGNTSTAQQGSGSLLPKSGNSNSTSTQAKGTLLPKKSK